MFRQDVVSSNVKSMGFAMYHQAAFGNVFPIAGRLGTVEVEYMTGSIYQYSDVPVGVYLDVLSSDSIGASLRADIVKRGYTCTPMVSGTVPWRASTEDLTKRFVQSKFK